MSRREEAYGRIEDEIRREKAATLGRAGERLEEALARVQTIVRQFETAHDPHERDRLAREYEVVRRRAEAARLALVIQREAIGLRRHAVLDQLFPELPRALVDR
jgi:hypothetical protein